MVAVYCWLAEQKYLIEKLSSIKWVVIMIMMMIKCFCESVSPRGCVNPYF